MKKLIEKSNVIIKESSKKWLPILETVGFPEEHYNLGAEYCEFHAKYDSQNSTIYDSTLAISLSVLKSLDLDSLDEYYLTDEGSIHSFAYDCEIDGMGHVGVSNDTILSHIEHIIRNETILMINKMIEKSEHKIAEFGIIIKSISLLREGTKNDKVCINVELNIK